jgi:hypothetical protein
MTGVGDHDHKDQYGALRSVVERPEILIEGSFDDGNTWLPFNFKYKPNLDVKKSPPWVAPHQPRLDWQMWFAALGTYAQAPWFINLIDKLLEGSPAVLQLLDVDSGAVLKTVQGGKAPDLIRSKLFKYDDDDDDEESLIIFSVWRENMYTEK